MHLRCEDHWVGRMGRSYRAQQRDAKMSKTIWPQLECRLLYLYKVCYAFDVTEHVSPELEAPARARQHPGVSGKNFNLTFHVDGVGGLKR